MVVVENQTFDEERALYGSVDTDLSFEKSEVEATLTAPIISIKNPLSGRIVVPAVGELIMDDENARGEVIVKGR